MKYCSILNRRVFVMKLEIHRDEIINMVYAPNEESSMFPSSVRKTVNKPNKRLIYYTEGAFARAFFLWQRPIVTETIANNLRSHIAAKSVKETMPQNIC